MASKKTKKKKQPTASNKPAPKARASQARRSKPSASKASASKASPRKAVSNASAAKAPPSKSEKAEKPAKKPAQANEMVHWEIQSQDPTKLHKFYADAFGWKIDANNPMNYGMVKSKGASGIDGGIGGSPSPGSRVIVYAQVPSIVATLKKIEAKGGKTLMPRTDLGMVIMALYQDPEGNTMGLVEGASSAS